MVKEIEIYTDGSCHTQLKCGAWASIIFVDGKKYTITGVEANTTHHRMEMMAVIESIRFADQLQFKGRIIVNTDSQYICQIPDRKEKLKQAQYITKKGIPIHNADLLQIFIQQIESHKISFVKIKAHQRTDTIISIYNSEVDMLCRQMVRKITII